MAKTKVVSRKITNKQSKSKVTLRKNQLGGYKPATSPDMTSTRVGLFTKDVSIDTIRDMFKRDELLYSAVNRLTSDVFDDWADVVVMKTNVTINESKTRELGALLAKLKIQTTARQAFISRMLNGYAIVGIGFPGDITEPVPDSVKTKPTYTSNIPWNWIKDLHVDLRPDSETYAKVFHVELDRPIGDEHGKNQNTQRVLLNYDRFVHWVMPSIDGDNPEGMPAMLPLHDMLTIKKNADWSLGEILWQFGNKHYVFMFPSTMPDDKYTDAKNTLKDFNVLSNFTYRGEPFEIKDFGGEGQLNPEPFIRYFTALLSIGLRVPYPVLFRGLTGGVSDVVQRDYASDVTAIQKNEVEPMLRELLQKIGWGNEIIEFRWRPIIEMDEREKAFITSRKALARNLESKAMEFYLSAGLSVELDDEGHIKRVFVPDPKMKNVITAPVTVPEMAKDDPEEEQEIQEMQQEDKDAGQHNG